MKKKTSKYTMKIIKYQVEMGKMRRARKKKEMNKTEQNANWIFSSSIFFNWTANIFHFISSPFFLLWFSTQTFGLVRFICFGRARARKMPLYKIYSIFIRFVFCFFFFLLLLVVYLTFIPYRTIFNWNNFSSSCVRAIVKWKKSGKKTKKRQQNKETKGSGIENNFQEIKWFHCYGFRFKFSCILFNFMILNQNNTYMNDKNHCCCHCCFCCS